MAIELIGISIKTDNIVNEEMSFGEALEAVLKVADHPSMTFSIEDLKFLPIYVRLGKISYEDLFNVAKKGNQRRQSFTNMDSNYPTTREGLLLQHELETLGTFISGVEVGKQILLKELIKSFNK